MCLRLEKDNYETSHKLVEIPKWSSVLWHAAEDKCSFFYFLCSFYVPVLLPLSVKPILNKKIQLTSDPLVCSLEVTQYSSIKIGRQRLWQPVKASPVLVPGCYCGIILNSPPEGKALTLPSFHLFSKVLKMNSSFYDDYFLFKKTVSIRYFFKK